MLEPTAAAANIYHDLVITSCLQPDEKGGTLQLYDGSPAERMTSHKPTVGPPFLYMGSEWPMLETTGHGDNNTTRHDNYVLRLLF